MDNVLIFNQRKYTFSDEHLNLVFKCMLFNENLGDEDKRLVLSFVTNKFEKKTWEELEYHEFVLNGLFRISNLLCNISNIFGNTKAALYAKELSALFEEEIEEEINENTTCALLCIGVREAVDIGAAVFSTTEEKSKFQSLLSLIKLFTCAQEDYEQTIENEDDFKDLIFINGIGAKKIDRNGSILIKPVHNIYDSDINEYTNYSGVIVPPSIICAVFNTTYNVDDFSRHHQKDSELFLHKLEQLSGYRYELKIPKDYSKWNNNQKFTGKWYNVHKLEYEYGGSDYTISVYQIKDNGIAKLSRCFVPNLDELYENWLPGDLPWKSDENCMVISPNSNLEAIFHYEHEETLEILHSKYGDYYRTFEDAKSHL